MPEIRTPLTRQAMLASGALAMMKLA
jgi:hypothetical protein